MNRFDHPWQKLIARARQAREERDPAAPLGFATRVAARAMAAPAASPWAAFEGFALRGLMVAAACGVAAAAFHYSIGAFEQPDDYAAADPVGEMLDLS